MVDNQGDMMRWWINLTPFYSSPDIVDIIDRYSTTFIIMYIKQVSVDHTLQYTILQYNTQNSIQYSSSDLPSTIEQERRHKTETTSACRSVTGRCVSK